MAKNKVYSLSDEEFIQIIQNSQNMHQVLLTIGYSPNGRYGYDLINRRIKELNLSTEHFKKVNNSRAKYTLDEILIENSTYQNISRLKERLIKENRLEYKCSICGNKGIWQDKPLVLQLDHINGNHLDHRIENLRFLCPNCHSQTETFCTRQPRAKSD